MLKVKIFVVNPLQVNSYVVSDERTKETAIIDCGCAEESEWDNVKRYIAQEGLTVKHLLNTHLHFDHIWGVPLAERDLGLKAEANYADMDLYNNVEDAVARVIGVRIPMPAFPPLGTSLLDGDVIPLGESVLKVITTPGHSQGGICFYSEDDKMLFAGDTLFCGSIGRTDLDGGNHMQLIESITSQLLPLPEDTTVYCGHGPNTTIRNEKMFNPYLP